MMQYLWIYDDILTMTKFGNTDTILVQILYSYMGLDECTVMFMKKMLKL